MLWLYKVLLCIIPYLNSFCEQFLKYSSLYTQFVHNFTTCDCILSVSAGFSMNIQLSKYAWTSRNKQLYQSFSWFDTKFNAGEDILFMCDKLKGIVYFSIPLSSWLPSCNRTFPIDSILLTGTLSSSSCDALWAFTLLQQGNMVQESGFHFNQVYWLLRSIGDCSDGYDLPIWESCSQRDMIGPRATVWKGNLHLALFPRREIMSHW